AGAAGSRKSRLTKLTPGTGSIGRTSMAITLPCLGAPTRSAATWLQPPGAAPRSTTRAPFLRKRALSSISMGLYAARDRMPSRLARATYGSLSWRSSQWRDEARAVFVLLDPTVFLLGAPPPPRLVPRDS